jgi:hypothetical protein
MSSLAEKYSRSFVGNPTQKFVCPRCGQGHLIPDQSTFFEIQPTFSKREFDHEAWEPEWITRRFSFRSICNNDDCGEVAFVSGRGGVERGYGYEGETEIFDFYRIESIFPAPDLISIPEEAPYEVEKLLKKCFALYWVDTSAAANALRASLEALMDEMKVPTSQKTKTGKIVEIYLHNRIQHWSETHKEYAELCFALKEVGNLGSHGETVRGEHFFAALEIYSHVLQQLFENNAAKMKELAEKIRSEIKGKKNMLS